MTLFDMPRRIPRICLGKDEQDIIAFNSGIYSKQVPVIPVCIVVKHADDISIVVETYYLIFGHTEMLIGDDGPTYLRTLF